MTDKYLLRAAQQAARRPPHPLIEKLRAIRIEQGIRQNDLAERMGYAAHCVCDREIGVRRSNELRILSDWAEALGYEITLVRKKEDRALMPGEL